LNFDHVGTAALGCSGGVNFLEGLGFGLETQNAKFSDDRRFMPGFVVEDRSINALVNLLIDSRDLIELLERNKPAPVGTVEAFLRSRDVELILSLTNIRELVSTLALNGDFMRVRPWLQSLERIPHLYIREVSIAADELRSAVDAFKAGTTFKGPMVFVKRWDETLSSLPDGRKSAVEFLVNQRLDDLIYSVYRGQPAAFAAPAAHVDTLRRLFDNKRKALKAGSAQRKEDFIRSVENKAATNRIDLPAGHQHEFAQWIYESPDRCPGHQLGYEVYRAFMENTADVPETSDFSDLAHICALPYVESATLDRRMRHYTRVASERLLARGGLVNYSERIYENLATFIGRNT
jgi:hypothetical protein